MDDAAARLRMALAMFDDGVDLVRRRLAREHPGDTADDLHRRLTAWLHERDDHPELGHLTSYRDAA